jgi:hypothetical protein
MPLAKPPVANPPDIPPVANAPPIPNPPPVFAPKGSALAPAEAIGGVEDEPPPAVPKALAPAVELPDDVPPLLFAPEVPDVADFAPPIESPAPPPEPAAGPLPFEPVPLPGK